MAEREYSDNGTRVIIGESEPTPEQQMDRIDALFRQVDKDLQRALDLTRELMEKLR